MTDLATGGQILIPFNGDDTLNQILINRCTVTIDDVCVHETRYEMIVNLPFRTGGYWLTYQRCCRNRSLNNVNDPLNTGMSLFVRLSEEAMQLGNSSPTFDAWAPIYICANERIEFNHTATDKDGDSLVYRLSTPWIGVHEQSHAHNHRQVRPTTILPGPLPFTARVICWVTRMMR